MDIISLGIASQALNAAKLAKTSADNAAETANSALATATRAEAAICRAGIFTGTTSISGTNIVTKILLATGSTQAVCEEDLAELKNTIGTTLANNGKAWIAVHSFFAGVMAYLVQRLDFLLPAGGSIDYADPDFMETRAVLDLSALGGSGILDKTVQKRWSDIVVAENDGVWEATLTITVSMV